MKNNIKEQFSILNRNAKQKDELYRLIAVQLGISDIEFRVLYYFCCSDRVFTQNDLSDLWSIPKQTISFAITGLIKKGYVHFGQMPAAHNSKVIYLTEKGTAFCQKEIAPILNGEINAFSRLTEEERNHFFSLSQLHHLFLLKEFNGLFDNKRSGTE